MAKQANGTSPTLSDSKENIPPSTAATTTTVNSVTSPNDSSNLSQTAHRTVSVSNSTGSNGLKRPMSPVTTPDSFLYQTKYVVLGFMKNLPSDVDERTWTPVSSDSTPSSEAGERVANDGQRKFRVLPKKHKPGLHLKSQITESPENEWEKDRGYLLSVDDNSDSVLPLPNFRSLDKAEGEESPRSKPSASQDLSSFSCSQKIDGPPLLIHEGVGMVNNDSLDCDHNIFRSVSSGSSRGDGSSITDADDELDSNSSSHNSMKSIQGTAIETSLKNGLSKDYDLVVDAPSSSESSCESLELPKPPDEFNTVRYDEGSGLTVTARQTALSSSATLVPEELSDSCDIPISPGEEDPFRDQTPPTPTLKGPSRADLHLNLSSQNSFRPGSNITESLQEVLEESSSHLQTEVNAAVSSGALSPTQVSAATCLGSPETEVARLLVRIADRVEVQYGHQLQMAVQNAFPFDLSTIPYEQFRNAFTGVMDDSLPALAQVALCLVYSQHLTLAMVQSGQRRVSYLIDHAARLVADKAADFIINQGGWNSLAEADIGSSVSPLSLSQGSGDSSRVNSPTKGHGAVNGAPPSPVPPGDSIGGSSSSGEESVSSVQSSADHTHSWSSSPVTALIRRAHHFGLHFSIAAAVAVLGIAVVLSKH